MWPILEVQIGEALAVPTSANRAKHIASASPAYNCFLGENRVVLTPRKMPLDVHGTSDTDIGVQNFL